MDLHDKYTFSTGLNTELLQVRYLSQIDHLKRVNLITLVELMIDLSPDHS